MNRLSKSIFCCCRRFSSGKTLRESFREYGPLAVGVYMSVSFTTFCLCLSSITFFQVDINRIQDLLYKTKKMAGWNPDPPHHVDSSTASWTSQILIAMAMTKLFVPIKLGITAALTPILARKLRYYGFNLSAKGGYKDASMQVRDRLKSFRNNSDKFPEV